MSSNYDGLTRNIWPGTWSADGNYPIVLDTELRGTLQSISGNSGDRLTDITGQRLTEGMLAYLVNGYTAGLVTRTADTYYKYSLLTGESRDPITGEMPNSEDNWTLFSLSGVSGFSGYSGASGPNNVINATNDTSTTALYPVMVNTAGSPATPKVSTSKIYFNAATGTIYATSKSFNIPHPTLPGKKLIYGSLEGPENGVYLRGRLKKNIIDLPDYWGELVDVTTTTVQLTPIGKFQKLYVKTITDKQIIIDIDDTYPEVIDCYFTVFAERKDIAKLQTVG